MPFRFGMRKAKRYEVSSKNAYIVCVHLLDSVLIECTLTAESTGQECLENISTRIGLNEIQYFGLRYVSKKPPEFRWVNLHKPLKKQLEKHAQSQLLYFGVMFCIGDILQIHDAMSRYQYYLHLKTEIINGRLQCTPEQAIVLAAYSVQAELGDYDPAIHGSDYLKNIALLPEKLSAEDHIARQLTHEIALMHPQLVSLPPEAAKLQYIIEAQELEGYGLEYYPVKDTGGKDLLLGTSFVGIFVKPLTGNQPTVYFKWSDIVNFTHSKRQLGIDTKLSDKPFYFTLDSPEYAKYVCQMCCRQQKFYKSNGHLKAAPASNEERDKEDFGVQQVEGNNMRTIPDLQQDLSTSAVDVHPANANLNEYLQSVNESTHTVIINESSSLNEDQLQTSLHQLHFVGSELPSKPTNVHSTGIHGGGGIQGPAIHTTSIQGFGVQGGNVHDIATHCSNVPVSDVYQHDVSAGISSMYNIHGVRSDLIQSMGLARLPSYRPPPDYKTIMVQKMERLAQQVQHQQQHNSGGGVFQQDVLAYSQPDIHQMPLQYVTYYNNGHAYVERPLYGIVDGSGAYHPSRPVDRASSLIVYPSALSQDNQPVYQPVSRLNAMSRLTHAEIGNEMTHFQPTRPVDRSSSLVVYPSVHQDGAIVNHLENVPDVAALFQYRLPPPYPRQSTSTPDLALQVAGAVSHSTPDLATCHGRPHLVVQSRFDQSMENLALDNSQLHFLQFHAAQFKNGLNVPSNHQPEFNHFKRVGNEDQQSGQADVVTRPNGQVDYGRSVGQVEGTWSVQQPYPDITRSAISRGNLAIPNTNPVDLSHMVMLKHLEKQNQVYLQSAGTNQTAAGEEYMEQLRLQEIFRNLRLNSSAAEMSSQVPMTTMDESRQVRQQRVPAGRTDADVEAVLARSEVVKSSEASVNNHLPNDMRLRISPEAENDKNVAVVTRMLGVADTRNVLPNTGNATVPVLAENPAVAKTKVADVDSGQPRSDSRIPEMKLEDSQVFAEFEQVPKKRLKFDCSTALQDSNQIRNRFRDVVPYEDNRVRLKPTKENPTGYINASHVRVQVGREEFWYIATQGPLEHTVRDFWQMVFENDVRVISMLTGLNDPEQRKCLKYWPNQPGAEHAFRCRDFTVALRYVTECRSYVTRGLVVRHDPSRTERLVWHLQYTDWPDRGCPSNHVGFLEYLDELSAIKRQVMTERAGSKPICVVVHCSAGVGRTGVVILTEMMRTTVEHNGKIDVPLALKTLREQRMHMVQTVSQYSFVYHIIGLYLQSSRLI